MSDSTATTTTTTQQQPPPITITQPPEGYYDSLPYIDDNYQEDKELHAQVVALISHEVQSSSKRRFADFKALVDHLYPTPPFHQDLTFVEGDYQRYLQKSGPNNKSVEFVIPSFTPFEDQYCDFNAVIPTDPNELSVEEWYQQITKLQQSIQHYQKHAMHLELHRRFGKEQWVHAIQDTITLNKQYDNTTKVVQDNIEYVNKVRKFRQDTVKDELEQMKEATFQIVKDNMAMSEEIRQHRQGVVNNSAVKRQRTGL